MNDLPADEVHLWLVPLVCNDALRERYAGLLSEEETGRCQRLLQQADRERFLLTRAALRMLLSNYHQMQPQQWQFTRNAHGRPQLLPDCGLCFNISHSAGVLALAIARVQPGVDIEGLSKLRHYGALARRYFSAQESAEIASLSGRAQQERFIDLWTLKEAWVKARGTGLSRALRLCRFAFPAPGKIAIAFEGAAEKAENWQFWQLNYRECRVAVALGRLPEQEPLRLRTFEFQLPETQREIDLPVIRRH